MTFRLSSYLRAASVPALLLVLAACGDTAETPAAEDAAAPEAAPVEAAPAEAAPAASADLAVPGNLVAESLTSDAAGNVYYGSIAQGAVLRAAAGGMAAEPFIASHADGLAGVFGVLADDASSTLWVCSSNFGAPPADGAAPAPAALYAFDLASGALKASYPFPGEGTFCNDAAVGPDGSVYATDTNNMHVVRLAPGAGAVEVWSAEGAFGPDGGVLDGIAVVGNRVVVNTLATNKIFAVEIGADGAAGAVTDLALDNPIAGPDGMRAHSADSVLVAEGQGGRLSQIVIGADTGAVIVLRDGIASPVAVTVVGNTAYVLEGQFGALGAAPDAVLPDGKAVAVTLP